MDFMRVLNASPPQPAKAAGRIAFRIVHRVARLRGQFQGEIFLKSVFEVLRVTGFDPRYLELELTHRSRLSRFRV